MTKKLLLLFAISLAVSVMACERKEAGTSDGWITAKVKLALLADQRVSGFATDVDTRSGVVTLSGKVNEDANKAAAEEVARKIEGVRNVNNQIQVVPDANRSQVNAADDKIEADIEQAMDANQNLKGLGLRADSNAGVVTLDGTVDTQAQLLNAAQTIRKIAGVKAVVTTPVSVRNERKS